MVVDIRHSSFIVGYVLFIMVGNIMEIDKDTPSESDEDIEPDINIPTLRQAPRTRSGTRGVIASFSEAIEGLFARTTPVPT
ncbi:unnamed protein product [Brassica oleracea var. botrytis]